MSLLPQGSPQSHTNTAGPGMSLDLSEFASLGWPGGPPLYKD